jgi:lysophospholipase L1-like esterase
MQKYIISLAFILAGFFTQAQNLYTGIYNNGATFTLRWNTNDQTLNNAPRVVGLGSSTLAGYLLTYPDRLGDKINAWLKTNTTNPVWTNLAVGGYSSADIMPTGNKATNIDSAINANPDFIFISLPTNDIANGLTNAQILANFSLLDSIALSHGIPIFWETTQPRNTFTTAQQTQLKSLADSIRNKWPTRFVEGFSTTTEPGTIAQIKTEYSAGDGVHLNTTGNQQIADSLFARWKRYFVPGTVTYVVEISTDGKNWSQSDETTDVKKTYAFTKNGLQYFRVKVKNTDAYSNIVSTYNSNIIIDTPAIVISGNTNVTQNAVTILSTTVTHEGSAPRYEWMDSTSNHSWQSIVDATRSQLSYTPAKTGDKVMCKLMSNAPYISNDTVYSNVLTFTVKLITAVNPDPVTVYGIKLRPNPVDDFLNISPLKISDNWNMLEIRGLDGRQYTAQSIKQKTSVTVPVFELGSGVYILVLKKHDGKAATMKFVKR